MSDVPELIHDSGAIKHGNFKLSGGQLTDYYVDKYAFETQPEVLDEIAADLADRLDTSEIDVIAGPELGAVPLAIATSLKTGIPSALIRKGQKHYGTQARVEGEIQKGDRVAIVEDVTTTAGTLLDTVELVEEVGGVPERLIVVVDRNQGAAENVREAGYELEHLAQVGTDFDVDPA